MKSAVATILAVCFAAATCSAHVLSGKPTVAVSAQAQKLAKEATDVGNILLEVAQGLSKDDSKLDTEYFLKDLFVKASNHIKEAVRKIKNVIQGTAQDMRDTIKEGADKAKQKAQEKAFEILAKIMGDSMGMYAAEDSQVAFRKDVCAKLERVGRKLIVEGEQLSRN
uniref:Putative conserved secreted protein midgut overexpressed n=1 Tax=Rhipicephalus microplus TaxID=6941 RepID=A0A6M2CGW8_RHIMP